MFFRKNKYIDLHMHSCYSDGTDTPKRLVQKAYKKGLKTIAITDHDCISGIEEGRNEAIEYDIDFIPGVEFSAKYKKTMHILGYFPNGDIENVNPLIDVLRKNREERNPKIIKKLCELGYPITMDDVRVQSSSGDNISRLHIARAIVDKGYAVSIREAFHRVLGEGKPAYFEKETLSPQQVICGIRHAGGVPVLAHPVLMDLSENALFNCVRELKGYGLMGIETYYSENKANDTKFLNTIATELDLIPTGGSDYHGRNKANIKMGSGKGNLKVPSKCADLIIGAEVYDAEKSIDYVTEIV